MSSDAYLWCVSTAGYASDPHASAQQWGGGLVQLGYVLRFHRRQYGGRGLSHQYPYGRRGLSHQDP